MDGDSAGAGGSSSMHTIDGMDWNLYELSLFLRPFPPLLSSNVVE
jgi:hypothetical protein